MGNECKNIDNEEMQKRFSQQAKELSVDGATSALLCWMLDYKQMKHPVH